MYIFASILSFVAVAVAIGFLYQRIGSRRDIKRLAANGRWIEIGPEIEPGSSLYLMEKGSGGPTVVFESGIAATNLNWRHIQEAISGFSHTVSYDRAGLGWSSPAKTARTPANIATELHSMLETAGIKPPFILVGHSFGGLVMRRYAQLFPKDVAGLVLVDPMRCEEWPPLDPAKQATLDRGVRMTGYAVPIAHVGLARMAVTSLLCRSGAIYTFLARFAGEGGRHVLARIEDEVGKMPNAVRPIVAAYWSLPGFYVGMAAHLSSVPASAREMLAAQPIAGIPVTLLTPGKSVPLSIEQLEEIGDNVRQVIAPASAHGIHLDEPEIVIDSIRTMVLAASPPAVSVQV
jgi:pimeloyl-ACP methyl ester carboxylesterase